LIWQCSVARLAMHLMSAQLQLAWQQHRTCVLQAQRTDTANSTVPCVVAAAICCSC
jgi:hypothetical protein